MALPDTRDTIIQYDVPCLLHDGTVLRANVARPSGEGRWPVILVRTPYGKDSAVNWIYADVTSTPRKGFVVIVQDARQRGKSDGGAEYMPFVADGPDGAEAIAWAATLPYSTGDVFTVGVSYCGYVQWAAAARQPPALRAMVPVLSPGNFRRSLLYRGGYTLQF